MQKMLSLLNNNIIFDLDTINISLEDILLTRFKWQKINWNIEDLYDPYLLPDMKKWVERIIQAYKNNEKVMIFWDYDVDGITGTSLLIHFFKKIWLKASYRLPHRIYDWYWLKNYFMDEFKTLWVSLVVTVDCWTKDVEVVKYAKTLWIDVIITDHHTVPDIISDEAIRVINPKRTDFKYPFPHLSWAWVRYKLIMALSKYFLDENEAKKYLKDSIDIRAIWTVADCMSLTSENRIIVLEWLKQIKNSRSKWLRKIIQQKMDSNLDSDLFSFLIWPRLNAAWRIDTPYKAINLILNNSDKIDEIIQEIEDLNMKRRELTTYFEKEALLNIDFSKNVLFYESKDIHHWIIWIIAWKLSSNFNKPAIVLKDEWDKMIASCRSPDYFCIVSHLEKFSWYFLNFWWHSGARWFSIEKDKYEIFKKDFLSFLEGMDFSDYKKEIKVDKVLDPLDFSLSILDIEQKYKPYWIGNNKPIYMFYDFEYKDVNYLWKTKDHIKIDNKYGISLLWFWLWEYYAKLKNTNKASFVFESIEDIWMGKKQIKAKIIDIIE